MTLRSFTVQLSLAALAALLLAAPPAAADSIYPLGEDGEQTTSLYSENYQPGDIVLIDVQERVTADQGVNMDMERESEQGGEVAREDSLLDNVLGPVFDLLGSGSVDLSTENSHEADGVTARDTQLNFELSAVVVEVLENGNLLLEARKEVELNRETQYAVIQAMARPEDIDGSNTIESSRLADVNMELIGEGELSDKTKPGFISRIFNKIF